MAGASGRGATRADLGEAVIEALERVRADAEKVLHRRATSPAWMARVWRRPCACSGLAAERALRERSLTPGVPRLAHGLPNRLLIDRLDHASARAARADSRAAVLFVDLDTFKNVNDSLGHATGDELLARPPHVSAALRAQLRHRGALRRRRVRRPARGRRLQHAVARVANRILESMEEPFVLAGARCSSAPASGSRSAPTEADDLLRNADLALYRAKSKGKVRSEVFDPEMHVAMVERLEARGVAARGPRSAELRPHFQPLIDLRTGEVIGVEALVRWQHPDRGLLLPGDFIPVAEDSRLMVPLGRWVLEEALPAG